MYMRFSPTHMAAWRHANKLILFPSPTVGSVKIRNNVITSRHNEDLACEGNFCKCLNTNMPAENTKAECVVHSFPVRHETRLTRQMRYAITELRLTAHWSKNCILGVIKQFNFWYLFSSLIGWWDDEKINKLRMSMTVIKYRRSLSRSKITF